MKIIISLFIIATFTSSQSYALGLIAGSAETVGVVNDTTAVANTAQGEGFVKKCTSAWPYCAMAVLAFAQVVMSLKGSSDAGKTKAASQCLGAYCDDGSYNGGLDYPTNGSTGNLGGGDPLAVGALPSDSPQGDVLGRIQEDVAQQLKNLGDKGYSYDAATNSVNTPNNGSIPASTFASSDGLKSLGMSDSQIADVQKIAADALKKASKYAGSAEYNSGGGGGKHKGSSDTEENGQAFDMNKYMAGLMRHKKDSRGVAGLEKNYGSDQIGVSQDNIFKMIHRRYEAKKTSLTP